ncbi:MAG: peroxiredoxin-like family protein [Pseudomonadota bacterium]
MSQIIPRSFTGLALALLLSIAFAGQHVPDSAEDVQPLAVGATAPDFDALRPTGEKFEFRANALSQPAMLIFYRGGWCPFCNTHLAELRDAVPTLNNAGVDVYFLSADRPEILVDSLTEKVDYELLSDASLEVGRRFGIAFRLDDETVEKYKGYGLDLEETSGYDHHQLPVPAVFLIGADGEIDFVHANPDYKERLEPAKLLAAAGISAG